MHLMAVCLVFRNPVKQAAGNFASYVSKPIRSLVERLSEGKAPEEARFEAEVGPSQSCQDDMILARILAPAVLILLSAVTHVHAQLVCMQPCSYMQVAIGCHYSHVVSSCRPCIFFINA